MSRNGHIVRILAQPYQLVSLVFFRAAMHLHVNISTTAGMGSARVKMNRIVALGSRLGLRSRVHGREAGALIRNGFVFILIRERSI